MVEEKYVLNSPDRVLDDVVLLPALSPSNKHTIPSSSIQDACTVYSEGKLQLPADWKTFDTATCGSTIVHAPPFNENSLTEDIVCDDVDATEPKPPLSPAAEFNLNIANFDLSPRLTSYIESGVVPESPLSNAGEEVTLSKEDGDAVDWKSGVEKVGNLVPELISTPEPCANLLGSANKVTETSSPQTKEIKTPIRNEISVALPDGISKTETICQSPSSPEFRTPLRNLTNTSCSEDWRMSAGKISGSTERLFRLKGCAGLGI